ncbi:MAG: polymorphic toxin-type HINT domain-containing protein [Chloroflexota bacterium]
MVQTPDGDKAIAELQVGDAILGYNEHRDDVDVFVVEATHKQVHDTTLEVVIDGETLHTTDEHQFFVHERDWVEAGQLNIGDLVRAADSSCGAVDSVTVIDEPQTMYNLTISLVATYLVGQQGWVVHNTQLLKIYICTI